MPKEQTGQLEWRNGSWHARFYTEKDGERIRVRRKLNTDNKAVAKRKLARLVKGEVSGKAEAKRADTVAEACEYVHKLRAADGVERAKEELARLRDYAIPVIGNLEVTSVTTAHINQALDHAKARGRKRETVKHLKQDLLNVFAVLKREGTLAVNPAEEATLPRFPDEVVKERQVLTDAELVAYLTYQHPEEQWQNAVLERQVMACMARMFGGLRTGDLHTLQWDALDTAEDGRFAWGRAPAARPSAPRSWLSPRCCARSCGIGGSGTGGPPPGSSSPPGAASVPARSSARSATRGRSGVT